MEPRQKSNKLKGLGSASAFFCEVLLQVQIKYLTLKGITEEMSPPLAAFAVQQPWGAVSAGPPLSKQGQQVAIAVWPTTSRKEAVRRIRARGFPYSESELISIFHPDPPLPRKFQFRWQVLFFFFNMFSPVFCSLLTQSQGEEEASRGRRAGRWVAEIRTHKQTAGKRKQRQKFAWLKK